MSEFENPHPKGTSKYRRRRIRNLLGFDSPQTITGEAQLHNTELLEVLRCVEEVVENADNSENGIGRIAAQHKISYHPGIVPDTY